MKLIHGMDRFLLSLQEKKQQSTLKRYAYDLKQFHSWLESIRTPPVSIELPTNEELYSYYSYLHKGVRYSHNTIRRILSVLKQWLKFMDQEEQVTLLEGYIQNTLQNRKTDNNPFLSNKEIKNLFSTVVSNRGLTDNQQKYRHLIRGRNEVIFRLILFYGVTIQELTTLTVDRIHFASNEIVLLSRKGKVRKRTIQPEDRKKMFEYYMTIPEAVRPGRYDPSPFFIAFDYQRGTYRWDYDADAPKGLSEVAMQKMIRQEIKRAGLSRHHTAQQLRKTYILTELTKGRNIEELRKELAFETIQPIKSVEKQWKEKKSSSAYSHERRAVQCRNDNRSPLFDF
ncbi:tyrosine-type recombinase/integrase [Evansella tamaricis]|uniref:Site-specific integrase n=1 Tax=Evansella tamaricis TaxID=2069301 RepID=A0ABS6JLC0_9BACI|nr:site-specific integrase [Evansella tamaricis]MBU9714464.1 site-specific integrase [Evansella tamaricis]